MRATISIPTHVAYGDDEDQPDINRAFDVLDAAYHTAHNFPGGVVALARRMGIAEDTLNKKVSLNTTTHHLTLREAQAMQEITGNVAILQAMASALGYDIVKTVPASSGDPAALNWQMTAAVADMQHAIADALTSGVSRNSLRRCDTKAVEASAAINNMLAALRAELPHHPAGPNA